MKLFNSKYNQSQYWIQTLQAKEDKREALGAGIVAQETVLSMNSEYTEHSQTVFSKDDTGHNEEETKQIQSLYEELNSLPVSPALAGI